MTAGRIARIMLGGLVGGLLGSIVPFLPSFLYAVVTGDNLGIPELLILLLLLITLPCGVVRYDLKLWIGHPAGGAAYLPR
jgi:hypothetical protein